ncbi:hypothetical protein HYU13_03420 [Candidatus Woesearchaeota archaeon]|nr:hypothetical protein [Candidatus Woesearchaeota archaeon]
MDKKNMLFYLAIPIAFILAASPIILPKFQRAYKRFRAGQILEETEKEYGGFKAALRTAQQAMNDNSFLLRDGELERFGEVIADLRAKAVSLDRELFSSRSLYGEGQFDDIRRNLHPDFEKKEGEVRITLADKVEEEKKRAEDITAFCRTKRGLRDSSQDNEWYLKARLMKPADPNLMEMLDDQAMLPDDLYNFVPKAAPALVENLRQFGPELNNSMGANAVNHLPALEHIIIYGKRQEVKAHAKELFDRAVGSYRQVKPNNDQLVWYRGTMDKEFTVQQHESLLQRQKPVIDKIREGDKNLAELEAYEDELHQQHFTYVHSQYKEGKSFSHTKLVLKTDSRGNSHLSPKFYSTEGYQFFFLKRKVTPNGISDEKVFVGEKDSEDSFFWRSWDYSDDQQPGYVLERKVLHDDNGGIQKGVIEGFNPFRDMENIEPEPTGQIKQIEK